MSSTGRPPPYFICLSSTNTLTNDTSLQPIFDSVGAGALTLPTGLFRFWSKLTVTGMSATSGNALIDWHGAGTASIGSFDWQCLGADGVLAAAGTMSGSFNVTKQSPASAVTVAINTVLGLVAFGTFRVTATGTMIPSIKLVTGGAADVVSLGTYFETQQLGHSTLQTVGPWS